jgi:hypothetical protein
MERGHMQMQTYNLNSLAEHLEVDRSTMVKAMRAVPADLVKSGNRPTWRIGTAWKALAAYKKRITDERQRRAEIKNGAPARVNAELQDMFDQLTAADAGMRAIELLEGRRAFAKTTLLPLLARVDRAMRDDGRACGEQEILTELRCDQHLRVFLVSGLGPDATGGCDWSPGECWDAYYDAGGDSEDEAA